MTSDLLFILWTPAPPVRITDRDGNPWFVAADVCRILGIENPARTISRLDDDERDTLHSMKGVVDNLFRKGAQSVSIINESGLYSLVLTSRKPEAKEFKRWITGTVLPSIRKHGGYIAGQGLARIQSALQGGQRNGGHRPSRQPWEPLTTCPESTTAMRQGAGGIRRKFRRYSGQSAVEDDRRAAT
ncbi:Bro-N domain-containing protein [Acidiphilium multivorum]|uniref:BRO-N domain-containing protein n=1 Tax=Acidiphilium multivorum TaxID=62140 RepID=UPI0039C8F1A4